MVTSKICIDKYGYPTPSMERKHMKLWDIPDDINQAIPELPNRLYCNKDLEAPLEKAFRNIMDRCLMDEIKTWDGCFNIRKKRGLNSWSLHSWGIAIDINASGNGLGKTPSMDRRLVDCFKEAGFDWGGTWTRPDGMHFQLSVL